MPCQMTKCCATGTTFSNHTLTMRSPILARARNRLYIHRPNTAPRVYVCVTFRVRDRYTESERTNQNCKGKRMYCLSGQSDEEIPRMQNRLPTGVSSEERERSIQLRPQR